jgi:uncharacterized protein YyaL (SSP411 family)
MLLGVEFMRSRRQQIAIILPSGAEREQARPWLDIVAHSFNPHRVLVVASESAGQPLTDLVPWVAGKPAMRGQVTAYVCWQGACELPAMNPAEFARQLGATRHSGPSA